MTDYAPTPWANEPAQTSPVNATNLNKLEAAVDVLADLVRQSAFKKALAATTANITLSGVQTVDGVALSAGHRCFVKDQSNQSQNGLYIVATGAWSRAPEADDGSELCGGTIIAVERGTVNGGKDFRCTNTGAVTINSTALTFTELGGSVGGGGTSYLTNGTTPLKYSAFLAAASGNHQTAFQNAINHIFTSSSAYGSILDLEGAKVNLTAPITVPQSGTTGGGKAIVNGIIEAQSGFSGGDHMLVIAGTIALPFLRLVNVDFLGQTYASWIFWDIGNLHITACRFTNPKPGTNQTTMYDRSGLYCSDGGPGGNADAGFLIDNCWFATGDASVQPSSRWTIGILSQTGDNKIGGNTTMSYFRHCCQFEAPGIVIGEFHPFQGTPAATMTDHTASLKFTDGRCGATLNGLYLGKSFMEISNETNTSQRDIGEIAITNMRAFADNAEAGFAHLVVRDYNGAADGAAKVSDITVTNSKFINGGTVQSLCTKLHNPSAFNQGSYLGILFQNNTFERTGSVYDVAPQANPVTLKRTFTGNSASKNFSTAGYFPFTASPKRLLSAIGKPTGGGDTSPQPLSEGTYGGDSVNIESDNPWIGDLTCRISCNNDIGAFQDG